MEQGRRKGGDGVAKKKGQEIKREKRIKKKKWR